MKNKSKNYPPKYIRRFVIIQVACQLTDSMNNVHDSGLIARVVCRNFCWAVKNTFSFTRLIFWNKIAYI